MWSWLKKERITILILLLFLFVYGIWVAIVYPYNNRDMHDTKIPQIIMQIRAMDSQKSKTIQSIGLDHSSIYLVRLDDASYVAVFKRNIIFPKYKLLRFMEVSPKREFVAIDDDWEIYLLEYSDKSISIDSKESSIDIRGDVIKFLIILSILQIIYYRKKDKEINNL